MTRGPDSAGLPAAWGARLLFLLSSAGETGGTQGGREGGGIERWWEGELKQKHLLLQLHVKQVWTPNLVRATRQMKIRLYALG